MRNVSYSHVSLCGIVTLPSLGTCGFHGWFLQLMRWAQGGPLRGPPPCHPAVNDLKDHYIQCLSDA